MSLPRISATVLTLDEERNIARCLGSLTWADEIVVVDAGSTDRTVQIARQFTERIVHHPWPGFLAQRRFSFDLCREDWIMFLDADEWVPPELGAEIRQAICAGTGQSAFWISRRNWFIDRWMDHVWAPDLLLRVFRKGAASLEGNEPHIHVKLNPGFLAGTLSHQLLHQAYHSIADLCSKAGRYSDQFAESDATDSLYSPAKLVLSPLVSMLKLYIWKRGFLEGAHGLVVAWISAHYHFLKYAKKWEKLRRKGARAVRELPAVAEQKEGHGR
ncbi:MAG: glycosyltransferase family 2 protein [Candidatus Riflebacteria bacterium]|nr:glycosyltransferase family 2 protein [Candidatus Riflebacteria bacterium]